MTGTDTLSEIGTRFGVDWLRIAEANGIAGPNYFVRAGQVLTIPAADASAPGTGPRTYRVTATDTLSEIGVRFGVDWLRIAEANGIAGPAYSVRAGQVLTIPAP